MKLYFLFILPIICYYAPTKNWGQEFYLHPNSLWCEEQQGNFILTVNNNRAQMSSINRARMRPLPLNVPLSIGPWPQHHIAVGMHINHYVNPEIYQTLLGMLPDSKKSIQRPYFAYYFR